MWSDIAESHMHSETPGKSLFQKPFCLKGFFFQILMGKNRCHVMVVDVRSEHTSPYGSCFKPRRPACVVAHTLGLFLHHIFVTTQPSHMVFGLRILCMHPKHKRICPLLKNDFTYHIMTLSGLSALGDPLKSESRTNLTTACTV